MNQFNIPDNFLLEHYKLGVYFSNIILKSQMTYIEINILPKNIDFNWHKTDNPYSISLYVTLAGSNKQPYANIDWHEQPNELLSVHDFDSKFMNYVMKEMTFSEFIDNLYLEHPILKDQYFLDYLGNKILCDNNNIFYHRFNTYSLSDDFQKFIGAEVKSFLLYQNFIKYLSCETNDSYKEGKTKI